MVQHLELIYGMIHTIQFRFTLWLLTVVKAFCVAIVEKTLEYLVSHLHNYAIILFCSVLTEIRTTVLIVYTLNLVTPSIFVGFLAFKDN